MGNIWNIENMVKRELTDIEQKRLYDIILNGNDDKAINLIRVMEDINQGVYGSETVLTRCCEFGRIEVLKHLIELGADVNKTANDGFSPLMYAAYKGHVEITRALIEAGADINYTKQNKDSALSQAVHYNKFEVFDLLLLSSGIDIEKCGGKALLCAAMAKNKNTIERLLKLNVDANYVCISDGMTPLHFACYYNKIENVELLLNNGADETIKNNEGKTAVELTINEEIKDFIKNYGSAKYVLK